MSHSVEDAEEPESLSGDVRRCQQRSRGECGGCGESNPTPRGRARAHAHAHARARGHVGGRNILRILRILRIIGRRQARATGLMALAKQRSWSSRWRSQEHRQRSAKADRRHRFGDGFMGSARVPGQARRGHGNREGR